MVDLITKEWIRAIARKDEAAWRQFFQSDLARNLLCYCNTIDHMARDGRLEGYSNLEAPQLFQEVCAAVFEWACSLAEQHPMPGLPSAEGLLYTIGKRRCLSLLRQALGQGRSRPRLTSTSSSTGHAAVDRPDPRAEHDFDESLDEVAVENILASTSISADCAAILRERLNGSSLHQISMRLDRPYGTVRSMYRRAIQTIRSDFVEHAADIIIIINNNANDERK